MASGWVILGSTDEDENVIVKRGPAEGMRTLLAIEDEGKQVAFFADDAATVIALLAKGLKDALQG